VTKEKTAGHRHHVLIVDDDRDYLAAAGDTFLWLSENAWQIHTASGVTQAVSAVATEKIRLAILDASPSGVEISELIARLRPQRPEIKIVVMAGTATEEKHAASLSAGADLFVEKPVSPEGLKAVFENLCGLIGWTPQPQAARKVGIADLIQLECQARNSSVLELFREHSLGRIYIEQGQIIHAVCGELSGEIAFQKLLGFAGCTFELRDFELPPERTLNRTWEFLLAEAARQRELSGLQAHATGGAADASTEPAGRTVELLVCDGAGEVLYDWQCTDTAARRQFLQEVARRAEALVPEILLGKPDRLEIQLEADRAILQVRTDRLVFARVDAPPKK
jgi:CheY-like chemotaxis protein